MTHRVRRGIVCAARRRARPLRPGPQRQPRGQGARSGTGPSDVGHVSEATRPYQGTEDTARRHRLAPHGGPWPFRTRLSFHVEYRSQHLSDWSAAPQRRYGRGSRIVLRIQVRRRPDKSAELARAQSRSRARRRKDGRARPRTAPPARRRSRRCGARRRQSARPARARARTRARRRKDGRARPRAAPPARGPPRRCAA